MKIIKIFIAAFIGFLWGVWLTQSRDNKESLKV